MNHLTRVATVTGTAVLLLLLFCALLPGMARRQPFAVTNKTLSSGRYKAVVTFRTVRLPKGEQESWWGGSLDKQQEPVVESVRMFRGREAVFIPVSAFAGLADVSMMSLKDQPGGCRVSLSGGDAGSSYSATVTIKATEVVQRVVRHGEFPDERWEKTTYAYIPDDGR